MAAGINLTVPLDKLSGYFKQYRIDLSRNVSVVLPGVAKSAVDTMRAAVVAAPPTKTPKGPPPKTRKRKQQAPDMPLINNGAIATGKYRDDWKAKRTTINGNRGILVYNSKVYAPVIEYGRRPGKAPPVKAIRKWLQVKFSLPYRRAKKLAYPIAKAIKRDGIPGRKIMTNTQTVTMFDYYLDEALTKAHDKTIVMVFR